MALSQLPHPFEIDHGEDDPPTDLERAIIIAEQALNQLEQVSDTLGSVSIDLADISCRVSIDDLITTLGRASEDLGDLIHYGTIEKEEARWMAGERRRHG